MFSNFKTKINEKYRLLQEACNLLRNFGNTHLTMERKNEYTSSPNMTELLVPLILNKRRVIPVDNKNNNRIDNDIEMVMVETVNENISSDMNNHDQFVELLKDPNQKTLSYQWFDLECFKTSYNYHINQLEVDVLIKNKMRYYNMQHYLDN